MLTGSAIWYATTLDPPTHTSPESSTPTTLGLIITFVAGGGPLVAVGLNGVVAVLDVGTNVFFNGVVLKLALLVIKGAVNGAGGGFFDDPGVPIFFPNIIAVVLDLHLIADELELQLLQHLTSSKLGFRKLD